MSGREARVELGRLTVGRLLEGDDGTVEFILDSGYQASSRRPVLGQWFEDRRHTAQRGEYPGALPAYFANLIPEGDLKLTLMERLAIAIDDDFGLLCAVGADLPGALVIRLESGEPPPARVTASHDAADAAGLRFSLAGVQLKFSIVRGADRFHMPGHDQHGGWIAKISYEQYPDLAANEWTTMEWARGVGFEVPRTELRALGELTAVPYDGAPNSQVFLIERYDRGRDGARTHQEDFQQIVGRRPKKKYEDMTYDRLARLVTSVMGAEAYDEFLRRLAFVIASGNNDAHMKNWSVVYPNGITPRWSPLYDQVFTARWRNYARAPALKVDGWREVREHPNVTPEYREALRRHWQRTPLLRPHALLS